jgi:hypothetical protein
MKFIERTFTISEVAALTGDKIETIKTWNKRNYFNFEKSTLPGWRRFSWEDLFSIAVFSEVVGSVGNYGLAGIAGNLAPQMVTEIISNNAVPYFIGADHAEFGYHSEIVYGLTGVHDHLVKMSGSSTTYGCFAIVDYSAILRRLFTKLTNVNGEQ